MLSLHCVVACFAMSGVGQTELLDFSATWCGPCRQMQPIVDSLAAQGYPIRKVDIDQDRALAQRFRVSAVPCFVMLVDGQEVDRVVGGTDRARLEQMLSRGNKSPGFPGRNSPQALPATFANNPTGAGVMPPPAAMPPRPAMRGPAATNAGPTTFAPETPGTAVPLPGELSADPLVTSAPSVGQGPHREALAAAGSTIAESKQAAEKCLAVSVRLKIEDADGNSVGSGTIIDARSGEALVLTCGHIFRDSKGGGKIYVDMFGSGAPKRMPGQLVGYDLKRDVGLVTFRPGVPVAVAQVAPAGYQPKPGDAVISVGCDNGREPSARVSRVTSTDKYVPPPNIQVAGQPVEGRSGGGLFTAAGIVIGVCNAADPADNEGLYAGVGSIHAELSRKGLTEMLARAEPPTTAQPQEMPAMAATMPLPGQHEAAPRVVPTSADDPRGPLGAADVTAAEKSLLEKLRATSGAAEVICIVRPVADPHAMSEIVFIDRASPDLVRQLSVEGRSQTARRLTTTSAGPASRAAAQAPASQPGLATSDSWQPNTGIRRFR